MKNNETKHRFAVLGGDRRQVVVAEMLSERGHDVRIFGLGSSGFECKGAQVCSDAEKAIAESEIVILPLPATKNGITLSCPLCNDINLTLRDIVNLAIKHRCKAIFGGNLPDEFIRMGDAGGIAVLDYYRNERLLGKNALASAEGALMVTMEHTEITLKGMKVLISGYGRIGSLLAEMLDRLGAIVTVAARRDEVLCEISLAGFRAIRLCGDTEGLRYAAQDSDVILNTVPDIVFTEAVLKGCSAKQLYVEIASSPGGLDLSAARDVGIRTVFAPSLPGRYAPISAGRYIFETVSDILAERGIYI